MDLGGLDSVGSVVWSLCMKICYQMVTFPSKVPALVIVSRLTCRRRSSVLAQHPGLVERTPTKRMKVEEPTGNQQLNVSTYISTMRCLSYESGIRHLPTMIRGEGILDPLDGRSGPMRTQRWGVSPYPSEPKDHNQPQVSNQTTFSLENPLATLIQNLK